MRSRKVATARHCRRGPCVYRAIRDGWPCPVIREKSQSRAQNDSLSLSPAHDSTSLYLHFRALGRPLLWAAYFWPQHHAGVNECGSFAAVILFLFALHRRSTWVLELLSQSVERGCMQRKAHRAHAEALGSSAQMRCVSW